MDGQDQAWLDYRRRMNDDNIRTLTILHRVYAGLLGVLSCCLMGYVTFVLGLIGFTTTIPDKNVKPPPAGFFAFFAGIWFFVALFLVAVVVMNIVCANWLRDRRNWTGIVVVSALNCLTGVLGIGLGVFTLIVVTKPEVRSTME